MNNNKLKSQFLSNKHFALAGLMILFIYLVLRAIFVPNVFDESATFFHYIHKGDFIPHFAHWDANNHILNSALSSLTYSLFGSSMLALRLPNLILFIVFVFFSYKISTEFKSRTLQWVFIITLALAHNFIEFFALARGYGMSMAFMFGSIWYLMQVLKYNRLRDYFLSALFISLAILANLTLMYTALIIVALLFINSVINYSSKSKIYSIKAIGIISITALTPIIILIFVLLEFRDKGLLYYGTLDGFWELTIKSLIQLLTESSSILIPIFIVFYFILSLGIFSWAIIKSKFELKELMSSRFLFFILLIGNLSAVLLLGYFMEINFPEDRTGLYFFPFFIGTILFALDQIKQKIKPRSFYLILIPFTFFPLHFIFNVNLSHSALWHEDNIPPSFMAKVIEDSKDRSWPFTIGGYQMRTLPWAFQNFRNGGELNQIQGSHYPEFLSDYQIVELKEDENWLDYYKKLDYDPISNLSLLKRNESISTHEVYMESKDPTGVINKKYFNIFKGDVDSLINETLLIECEISVKSEKKPFIAWLVATVSDKENKKLMYEFVALDWKKTSWNDGEGNFKASIFLHDLPAESKNLFLYFWNIELKEYELNDIKCSILLVE